MATLKSQSDKKLEIPGLKLVRGERAQMRMRTLSAGILLGVIWGLWHLPLFFLPGTTQYASVVGSPWAVAWYAEFVAETTALSILLAWIYNNMRGSVLLTMLLHAAANTAYSLLALIGLVTTWQVLLFFDAGLWLAALVLSAARLLNRQASKRGATSGVLR